MKVEELEKIELEIDIGNWEMNSKKWEVKEVKMKKEMKKEKGINMKQWKRKERSEVDINKKDFEVGIYFKGEERGMVEKVEREIEERVGKKEYF